MKRYVKFSAFAAVAALGGLAAGGAMGPVGAGAAPTQEPPSTPKASPSPPPRAVAEIPGMPPGFENVHLGATVPAELKFEDAFIAVPAAEPGGGSTKRKVDTSDAVERGYRVVTYYDHWYRVMIGLPRDARDAESMKLAEEARRTLETERPENPGRAKSFPTWKSRAMPPNPDSPVSGLRQGTQSIPLVHSGWLLLIRRIEATPGGWKASVDVRPYARTEFYTTVSVLDHHVETYMCVDGKLKLEEDHVDPDREGDPAEGIRIGRTFGSMSP